MRYPNVGDQIRVKNETGLIRVKSLWKPDRVQLEDGRIFHLRGIVTQYQKTVLTFITQGNYGCGWEDVTADETYEAGLQSLRDYRDNDPHPHRPIRRREPNPLYKE